MNMVGTAPMSPKERAVAPSAIAQRIFGLSEAAMDFTLSSGDSTANATTSTLSPYFFLSVPNHCSVDWHGGHQVAQNSTKTTRPFICSAVSGLPARSVSENFGSALISSGAADDGVAKSRA